MLPVTSVQPRTLAAERHSQQHRRTGVTGVQDRLDIQGQGRKPKALTRRRAIRQARAPPVKQDHAGARREPAPEVLQCRFLPGQLQLADQRRDGNDRDRPVADHRIRDRHPVISARVPHLGPQHVPIVATGAEGAPA